MKIRTRLTLYFTALVMTLITLRSSITYFSTYTFTKKTFFNRLEERAHTTADLLFKDNRIDSALLKEIDRSQYDILDHEKISIYDSLNRRVYTTNDTLNFEVSPLIFDEVRLKTKKQFSEGPYRIVGLHYTDSVNNVVVISSAIDSDGNALLRQVRITLMLTLLASVVINLVLGWFFVGKVLEPISTIIRKVGSLSPVEKSERLPLLSEKDEIAELVKTFNLLFDKLEQSFKLQKGFTANASHELFNPLTKIKSQLEVSLMQDRNNDSYRQTIHSVLDDLNDLIAMTHDLLNFSKLQSDFSITRTPVRVDELVFEVRDAILFSNPAYSIQINIDNPPESEQGFTISANEALISIAIKNIIENACKFSSDNSSFVRLSITGKAISLSVADKGPGISQADMKFIFQPFYRSTTTNKKRGFGIGLALAHEVLKAHGFSIGVKSELGVGSIFTINF